MAACKDCGGGNRPAPHPGPRCATHHRQRKKAVSERAYLHHIKRVYGLSEPEYSRLVSVQGGTCAICRRATGKTRRLSVDHNHKTGFVRGLLCRPCNDLLGWARDDPALFERAAAYLRVSPASVAGIEVRVEGEDDE